MSAHKSNGGQLKLGENLRSPAKRNIVEIRVDEILALDDLDARFALCLLRESVRAYSPQYWLDKAEEFEAAAPKKGDFHGESTREELLTRWENCMAAAKACRVAAHLLSVRTVDYDLTDIENHA